MIQAGIRGRPLRSLAVLLGGWTAMRLALVLPVPAAIMVTHPILVQNENPFRAGNRHFRSSWMIRTVNAAAPRQHRPPVDLLSPARRNAPASPASGAAMGQWSSAMADGLPGAQTAFARTPRAPRALASFAAGSGLSAREAGVPGPPTVNRWSGAGWMIWRKDGRDDRPMLAGSQAGVRVDYALDPGSALRPALYGRVSSALGGLAAAEVATGIAIRPRTVVPIVLAVERRQALSRGGRSDFAVVAAAGVNPTPIGAGFRLDGYGQAGIVGIQRRDAFIDGRVTVERPVIGSNIAFGAGVWGGAQPGVSRLDVGPQASVRLRVGGAALRVGAEWRTQVAGNATPASGPALSVGTDF
ncbi:hypothetical protein BH10PSE13_BH10PSE13_16010 [soil metagenome]